MRAWLLDGPKTVTVERVVENNYSEDKLFDKFSMIG